MHNEFKTAPVRRQFQTQLVFLTRDFYLAIARIELGIAIFGTTEHSQDSL